jgi:hypothetical protein
MLTCEYSYADVCLDIQKEVEALITSALVAVEDLIEVIPSSCKAAYTSSLRPHTLVA